MCVSPSQLVASSGLFWLTVIWVLKSCGELLGAFLTPELRDRLLSDTDEESYDRVENHCLLRKSAAAAFAKGYFQLSFYRKSKVGYSLKVNIWHQP